MKLSILLFSLGALSVIASDKASVTLTESGYSSSGGRGDESVEVKISKGWSNAAISAEEKIFALEQKIAFYKLMEAHEVNLEKKVTAAYSEKPLGKVLKDLLPGVPIEYKGVDASEKVKSMSITKASLESVLIWLDDAAGVYFTFSEKGIKVSAKPPKTKKGKKK